MVAASLWASTVAVADCAAPMGTRVKLHPSVNAYGELGAWFAGHGQPGCAIEAYQAGLKIQAGNEELTLGLATALSQTGEEDKAGTTLVQAVKAAPSSSRLAGALVLFLARHGQLDQAYALAERFAKLHPRDNEAQKLYLRVLVATGDAAGQPLAKRLLAMIPHDGELLYLNGVLERKAEEYPAAKAHLEGSIAQTPEFADSRYNLGMVLARMGDNPGARTQLEKAIALGIAEPEAHLELSKVLRTLGDATSAEDQLEVYRQAMQANTAHTMALSKSAEAARAMEKGDASGAVSLYHEALEASPKDASLAYKLSQALDREGDLSGERAALEQVVGLDPHMVLAQHQLGYVLSRAGDQAGAETHFLAAVQADPKFTQAWISLAATWATEGKMADAKEALERALRLDAHNAEALQMRRMLVAATGTQ